MKTRNVLLVLAVLVIQLSAGPAGAFGAPGHWTVGVLAYDQLSPAARERLETLVPGGRDAFGDSCNWPDWVKFQEGEYALTRPLHYVNIPRGETFQAPRHCREGNCVVDAIGHFAAVVGNRDLPLADRQEAVKFVCHFVGDLHQPLHVGYGEDKGGNSFLIPLGDTETVDLHTVWDHLLPALLVGADWMDASVAQACDHEEPRYQPEAVVRWTTESRALLETPGLVYPGGGGLDAAYLGRGKSVVRKQLCIAGRRLHRLLETVLE